MGRVAAHGKGDVDLGRQTSLMLNRMRIGRKK
jgi:hypothetical protein